MSRFDPPPQWPPLHRKPALSRTLDGVRRFFRRNGIVLLILIILGVAGFAIYQDQQKRPPGSSVFTPQLKELVLPRAGLWQRPESAPNGSPWPVQSGYISGYPRLNIFGMGDVVADNTGGDGDLFVKLIDRDQSPMTAARVALVKAKHKFTMERIKPGHYDIRYQFLDTGQIRKTKEFEVTVTKSSEGEQFMGWVVGLYDVLDGNEYHEEISERDF